MDNGTVTLVYDLVSSTANEGAAAGNGRSVYIAESSLTAHPEVKAAYDSNSSLTETGDLAIGTAHGKIFKSATGQGVLIFEKGNTLLYIAEPNADAKTLGEIAAALREVLR